MAKLAQRLRLDLTDPLASDPELLADFLEGPATAVLQAEAELENVAFPCRKGSQDIVDVFAKQLVGHCVDRGLGLAIFQEIAQPGVLFLADGRLEGDRL